MIFIKKLLKNSLLLLMSLLSLINKIIPKRKYILFFTNNHDFNDNNKALLAKLYEEGYTNKYKIIYCSKDGNKYQPYDQVKYYPTILAPFYFLISKYCFYDAGTIKIKPSKKQKVISLWHGIPLKKIGALINEKSSCLDKYNDFTKILVPHTSLIPIYQKSFECRADQILINGFPRNDYLFSPSQQILEELGIALNYKKYLLWMPTFRKSIGGRYNDSSTSENNWDLPIFNSKNELKNLNEILIKNNSLLTIKLHPYSVFNKLKITEEYSNIIFIRNSDLNKKNIINYQFIANFDCLITDYSSVFFDYLLIDKPLAFTLDDISEYENNRGFTVTNPEDFLVGDKISNQNDFYTFISKMSLGIDDFAKERNSLKNKVHKNQNNQATTDLIKYLNL